MKCRVRPAYSEFGITSALGTHLVKSGDTVSHLELSHSFSHSMDSASDIIALVQGSVRHVGEFPIDTLVLL